VGQYLWLALGEMITEVRSVFCMEGAPFRSAKWLAFVEQVVRHQVFSSPAQFPGFLTGHEKQAPVDQPECLLVRPVDTGKYLAHLGFVLVKLLQPGAQRSGVMQAVDPPVTAQDQVALKV